MRISIIVHKKWIFAFIHFPETVGIAFKRDII